MSKENKEVKISKAKGRPMLTWVGKKPLTKVKAFPAQHIEQFEVEDCELADCDWSDWPEKFPKGGLLFHGDNKDAIAYLLANGFRGKVKLIYIDPPFDSGADYVRKVKLRGGSLKTKLEGEEYATSEQVQYSDIWKNDTYLQYMYERLQMLRELLDDGGAIFLHCDSSKGHYLRMILDEVFGPEKFVNEIIWSYKRWPSNSLSFQSMHDTIYYYVNKGSHAHTFHKQYEEASESYMKRFGGKTQILDEESKTRKITSDEETKGMPLRDVWDLSIIAGFKSERTGYPTQKPEELLERIISICSNPGDLVLDCFSGSGTTMSAAQKTGRKWIGCDINKGAIQTTAKRLQSVMQVQAEETKDNKQADMLASDENSIKPAQSSFNTYRVNDYDLQIQHNEVVELACEHIGITRNRADHYFDGSLGSRLVKITPFNHPLTPLDLEDLRVELHRRPEEERDITVVCLGMELASRGWLEEYNRNRPINKVHVIELRTDQKYGGFIKHEPLVVSINIEVKNDKLLVEVTDVFSPTIIQRLNMEQGVFRATIEDWRSVVDCIMIDTEYDGEIFNVALTDIPAKKQDLVEGRYELSLPPDGSIVAVKVIDMLGEEMIITKSL